jgi:hypothetical protein
MLYSIVCAAFIVAVFGLVFIGGILFGCYLSYRFIKSLFIEEYDHGH